MSSTVAAIAASGTGAGITPLLTVIGLRQVDRPRAGAAVSLASVLAGVVAGLVGYAIARHAGQWAALPGTLLWAAALTAAAICDSLTKRIPTALVRQATVAAILLLTAASIAGHSLDRLAAGLIVAAISGGLFYLAHRFSTMGPGDPRLATLGGFGAGWAGYHGLVAGMLAFSLATTVQVAITVTRARTWHTTMPYGPSLAIGFLVAAAV